MTEVKIYVADLAAYNVGILYGVWVDATMNIEEIMIQIHVMLVASPVSMAEEFAIHDYEGFEDVEISEYESLGAVHEKALLIEEHGKLGAAVLDYYFDMNEARTMLEENYYGQYQSVADYAQGFIEQSYDIPQYLEGYVDYEKMARDMELNGEIWTLEIAHQEVHVFLGR